jgi:DNA-binding transcriptional ArsR family regulator
MEAVGLGASLVLWLLWIVAWLLLAVTASMMAEDRGQPPALWFALGLLFPILALIVLAVVFDRDGASDPRELTLADVARRSPVARALGERPGSSAHQLEGSTSLPPKTVTDDLRTLRGLGLVDRDDSGRWSLTDEGVAAQRSSEPAEASE